MRSGFLFLLVLTLHISVFAYDWGTNPGDGSAGNPYQISEPNHLMSIGSNADLLDRHFLMTANINMESFMNFETIGYYNSWGDQAPFTGVFNGNYFTISNLTYNSMDDDRCIGLFSFIKLGAEIRNLGLIDPVIYAPNSPDRVGALVGFNYGGTLINNCYITGGNITGRDYVGGLIGQCEGEVRNCHTDTQTNGRNYVGGLCGGTGYSFIGDCYTKGIINGIYSTGGLIGLNYRSEIKRCFSNAYTIGELNTGGLVGRNGNDAKIYNCYSAGNVDGLDISGGLVGANQNDLEKALVSKCYSSATVTNTSNSGALIGIQSGGSETIKSFWNEVINPSLDGISNSPDDPNAIGISVTEMQTQSTFTDYGWDFLGESTNGENDIWRMCTDEVDYPRLSQEYAQNGDFACGDGVDILDLQTLAEHWLLTEAVNPTEFSYACDANGDGVIDLLDYAVLGENW